MHRPPVFSLTLADAECLGRYYLSFVAQGGLFVPTSVEMELGDQACLTVVISYHDRTLGISGRVVWVSPANLTQDRPRGLGLEFIDADPMDSELLQVLRDDASKAADKVSSVTF